MSCRNVNKRHPGSLLMRLNSITVRWMHFLVNNAPLHDETRANHYENLMEGSLLFICMDQIFKIVHLYYNIMGYTHKSYENFRQKPSSSSSRDNGLKILTQSSARCHFRHLYLRYQDCMCLCLHELRSQTAIYR